MYAQILMALTKAGKGIAANLDARAQESAFKRKAGATMLDNQAVVEQLTRQGHNLVAAQGQAYAKSGIKPGYGSAGDFAQHTEDLIKAEIDAINQAAIGKAINYRKSGKHARKMGRFAMFGAGLEGGAHAYEAYDSSKTIK